MDFRNLKFFFWRGKPVFPLTLSYKNSAGRSTKTGRITVGNRSSGTKKIFRVLDIRRQVFDNPFFVIRVEYDPYRSNSVFLILYQNGYLSYIPSFLYASFSEHYYNYSELSNYNNIKKLKFGDSIFLGSLNTGSIIHNVEDQKNLGFSYSRAGLTSSLLVKKYDKFVILKLPSGKFRSFPKFSRCVLGYAGLGKNIFNKFTKAGQSRLKGNRPVVRGVAMNPVDHPHGGGEGKTSGGRLSVSPWGKLTKGFKTRKNYVYSRSRKNFF